MKFYDPKYKQLDLGLLRSSLDELDKTNRDILEVLQSIHIANR